MAGSDDPWILEVAWPTYLGAGGMTEAFQRSRIW